MSPIRIGYGIDFHQLGENRRLMIGGVEIPFDKGSVGHSDADVLLHAICDALLGALSLGDIGTHFPDTDSTYKGIESKKLLKASYKLVQKRGYRLGNMDCSVCLQNPKLKPYISQIRKQIAECMEIDTEQVSVKATTTEEMGYVGRGEGIEAHATVLLEQ